jgi:hypothetical protein
MNDPHLRSVLADLDRLEPRARELVLGLDDATFRRVPPDGGWSIAQVFEHLCIADASYLDDCLPAAIERAKARRGGTRWRSTWIGAWLRKTLARRDNKLPAPKPYRVGTDVRPDVVEAWLSGVRRLRELVVAADGLDLNVKLRSPVAWFVRLTLGDALAIPVVHGHRHLDQVARIRAAVGG